ncbi:MAG: recombinase family protein [Firmicutes bacterium]|nr:recombinase family protein [Bacillota bacterium]
MSGTRVVAYARVSSREQADKELSIPAQLKAIRKYCQDKDWNLVGEYIDEGKSAKTTDRPAFQKMIVLAKKPNRHFDTIIVHKFDRFSRSREDHVIFKALLKKLGVSVYSITEQTDPETPHGFLLEGMLEVISEFYNMNLSAETRKGMVENAKRGYHNGGSPPYGYRIGKIKDGRGNDKSVWVVGPDEEVNTVRRIYDLYVRQNKGYRAIVNILNDEGVPSGKGKKWSWTTVWHILHNDAYIGRKVWNKYDYSSGKKKKPESEWIVSADAHQPIIDRETFNSVKVKSNERDAGGAAMKAGGPSLYLLRGILKCPQCGVNMVTGTNSRSSRGHARYYHCGTYHRQGTKACKRNGISKDKIELAVMNTLIREFSLLAFPGSLEDEIQRYLDYQNREVRFQLARIEDDLKHVTRRIDLAKKESEEGQRGFVLQYIKELEGDIETLKSEKQQHEKECVVPTTSTEQLQIIRDKLKEFVSNIRALTPDIQHNLLKSYLSSVSLDPVSGNYKLKYKLIDTTEPEKVKVVLEKSIYFSLDLQ